MIDISVPTPTVEISSSTHPWSTIYALSKSCNSSLWLLTGGLMIQLHAIMNGITARPTSDADLLIDVISNKDNVRKVYNALKNLGFSLQTGLTGYATRLRNQNNDVVDLLIADHTPKKLFGFLNIFNTQLLSMPGGSQAINRSMLVTLIDRHENNEAMLRIPDLLGALILKSAAYKADNMGNREKHLYDAALIASLIDNPDSEASRLHSKNDYKRLRFLKSKLTKDSIYWDTLDANHKLNGLDTLETLTEHAYNV
ncbi:hypothetical protein [Gardnerella vaginalis]|uniref:hypothetical protein n=2 Tax=Gardnerella vaginalis TaxID=2702 RepID=UPI00040084F7|nr:hypothetical protein [Gardnerella vaginalis]NSX29528.1 hypothetical protein [Gardnerella vaginalis]PKZ47028.1 hypothetical protein CYJ67_04245 [Gardnerella vaginalis]